MTPKDKNCLRPPRVEKLEKKESSCCLEGKVGFYFPHQENIGKIEKNQIFHLWGIFMDVHIWFWCLGQIFIPTLNFYKQNSHDWSISWVSSKFEKSAVPKPPLCKKKFFRMPFLMSHRGYSTGGLNLPSPENLYHTICVVQRLSLLKVLPTKT